MLQEPVVSMHSGKIIWVEPARSLIICLALVCVARQAKGNEIQTANLKLLDEGVTAREGEKVPLSVKDLRCLVRRD